MPSVAVLGASSDRSKFGNKAVRAYIAQGYDVYPINPKGGEIEGQTVFRSLAEAPVDRLDRVTVYLPPAVGVAAMDDIAAKGAREVWLNPGADAPEVVERARELGLEPIVACSIVDLGVSPASMPDA